MTLQVIGTGFGRTGTDSMREALDILGFGPCHHMREVNRNDRQTRLWRDHAANGGHSFAELFEGFNSCIDWPSAYYWRELVDAYPAARVLLTWRDSESWWRSFMRTIYPSVRQNADDGTVANVLVLERTFGGKADDKSHAISIYESHVEDVKRTVPADRLLIHKIGDGWTPLCRHLGVAVPDSPFPHRNTTAEFNAGKSADGKSAQP